MSEARKLVRRLETETQWEQSSRTHTVPSELFLAVLKALRTQKPSEQQPDFDFEVEAEATGYESEPKSDALIAAERVIYNEMDNSARTRSVKPKRAEAAAFLVRDSMISVLTERVAATEEDDE